MSEFYEALSVRAPHDLLRALAEEFEARGGTEDGSFPVTTLLLANGASLSGTVVGCRRVADQAGDVVAIAHGDLSKSKDIELSYVPLLQVSSVTIRYAERAAELLGRGAQPARRIGDPPTRLELRRELAAQIETALGGLAFSATFSFDSMPDGPDALANAQAFLPSLVAALAEISSDEMGRDALVAVGGLTVAHEKSSTVNAALSDTGIALTVNFLKRQPKDARDKISAALNGVL